MGASRLRLIAVIVAACLTIGYLFWRHVWFFRNPPRTPPAEAGIVSPADGVIVYVRSVAPGEDVVVIKEGVQATVKDILREDVDEAKVVIGIFMSPFDVHFNRAPVDGSVGFIRHYPAQSENAYMATMHWRTLFDLEPYYAGSMHIVQNERTVTYFDGQYRGAALPVYVVQIGACTVNGIDSYYGPGEHITRGATFGMIRIGLQVDLIVLYLRVYNDDPCFAPAGHTVVQAMLSTDYTWWATRGTRYGSEKDAVAATVLAQLEPHFPGIRAATRVIDVATPLTYWSMARAWRGAFEGWMPNGESFFGQVKKTLTGLRGFYMAGQWVEPGGGIPMAVMSGRQALQLACADEKRPFVAKRKEATR